MGRKRRRLSLNRLLQGVLVLNKPDGITSQDACSEVKQLLRLDKVGHGGTLDPFATGVLPLLFNSATRVSQHLTAGDKEYKGTIKLGVTTDTQDPTGEVTEERPVEGIDLAQIEDLAQQFLGEQEQLPPLYSAVRVQGRRMYELARENVPVERKPKRINIYRLEVLRFEGDEIDILVRCSVGTYVRTLAQDIGDALGVGGHLKTLQRTASGPFVLAEAIELEELRELVEEHKALPDDIRPRRPEPEADWWREHLGGSLKSLAQSLPDHRVVEISPDVAGRLRKGLGLRASDLQSTQGEFDAGAPLILDSEGMAIALGRASCRSDVARRMPPDSVVVDLKRLLA